MRSTAARLTTAASITILLALNGTETAVAQPGSQFQTQGIRQGEGLRRTPYHARRATRRYYGGTRYYGGIWTSPGP
jgi:hypothetical protein